MPAELPKGKKSTSSARFAGPELVARTHYSTSPEVGAIWDELIRMELPRAESCGALFDHMPQARDEIEALGKTCLRKPPIAMRFNRRFAFRYSDNWLVHLGRVIFESEKARALPLYAKVKEVFGEDSRMSGLFYYPPGGFKEWHTDFEDPQQDPQRRWRIYLIKSEEDRKSWFQYLDPASGKIKRVHDQDGYLNLFSLTETKPLYHAVYSNTHRWSLGIKMGDEAIRKLLDCPGLERVGA